MKILLTGSSGFIGRNVVKAFPEQIVCLVRCGSDSDRKADKSIPSVDSGSRIFNDISSIIHLGGLAHRNGFTSSEYHEVNFINTLDLAINARKAGVKRFVFVSSIGVNGTSTQAEPFSLDSEPSPHNDYAQSKYDAEIGLKKIAKETGLEVVIVRPTLVYGPDAPGNFGMLTKLIKRLPVLPFGLATNRRDFISVQNLADLLVICATHPNAAGHTFLASDSETVSIKEFTNAIAKGLGKKVFQLPVPVGLMGFAGKLIGKSAMIEQLYGNLEVDSSNIKEVLGWTPPFAMEQSMAFLKPTDK
ncbi:NAD-dependent epimerase/dehydratase family protein [Vibrio vulnificus]|uniref:NAD-dependent epimerase/dehydratase family protein n=1 Tax=Vibrio vulnificus TaxID=672 RepID=UPI0030EBEAA5